MDIHQPKRRANSNRWEEWDYGSKAAYFVTTVTKNRLHWFGEIMDNEVILSEIGRIAYRCWEELPKHFKDVELGEFVIMPNHVHGIIFLMKDHVSFEADSSFHQSPVDRRRSNKGSNTISAMMNAFKSAVSKEAHLIAPDFQWHRGFHDRVMRDFKELDLISDYIIHNPKNWQGDEFGLGTSSIVHP